MGGAASQSNLILVRVHPSRFVPHATLGLLLHVKLCKLLWLCLIASCIARSMGWTSPLPLWCGFKRRIQAEHVI